MQTHCLWEHLREWLPFSLLFLQAEQEHALAEGKKHAAAAQAQLSAELDTARARLAAASEELDQQQRSFTAGAQEERRAAQSKEALLQASATQSPPRTCECTHILICTICSRAVSK